MNKQSEANELARPHERERDGKQEHVAAGLHFMRT